MDLFWMEWKLVPGDISVTVIMSNKQKYPFHDQQQKPTYCLLLNMVNCKQVFNYMIDGYSTISPGYMLSLDNIAKHFVSSIDLISYYAYPDFLFFSKLI